MKKIFIYLTLLLLNSGCQALSQTPQQSNLTSTVCPSKPNGKLEDKNVKDIYLTHGISKISTQTSPDNLVGYSFEAKSGQKLSYRTSDNICIWLYSPENKLLSGGDLPLDGKYILQVSAPKGSTTFNLEMTFGSLQASAPSISPLPSPAISHSSSSSLANSQSNSLNTSRPTSSNTETSDLTEEQALEIVQQWYRAKPQIFAPPFDLSLVDKLTTGKLHEKTINSDPEIGTVAWLRTNNAYYTYNKSQITRILKFSNSGLTPYIKISADEELYLHHADKIDPRNSGEHKSDFIYFFDKDNGTWKISEYSKVN